MLVQLGGNPSVVWTVSGRPVYVHLNGLVIVRLKYSMNLEIAGNAYSDEHPITHLSDV